MKSKILTMIFLVGATVYLSGCATIMPYMLMLGG